MLVTRDLWTVKNNLFYQCRLARPGEDSQYSKKIIEMSLVSGSCLTGSGVFLGRYRFVFSLRFGQSCE